MGPAAAGAVKGRTDTSTKVINQKWETGHH
jgi:hypothetical protein